MAVVSFALASCNDLLDKYPDSRMDLKNPSEVSQLLVSAYPSAHPAYLTEMYSDNTDEQMHSTWSTFDRFQEQAYQWKDIDEVSNPETPHQLWEAHYAAISTCNETLGCGHGQRGHCAHQEREQPPRLRCTAGRSVALQGFCHVSVEHRFLPSLRQNHGSKQLRLALSNRARTSCGPFDGAWNA